MLQLDEEEETRQQLEGILMQSTIPLKDFGGMNNIKDYELALDWCRKFDERENALDYLEDLNRVKLLKNLLNIKKKVGLTEIFLTSCFRHSGNSLCCGQEDYSIFTRIIHDWMSLQLSKLQKSKETKAVSVKTAFDYLMEEDDGEMDDEENSPSFDEFNNQEVAEEEEINFDEVKSDEPPIVNILEMISNMFEKECQFSQLFSNAVSHVNTFPLLEVNENYYSSSIEYCVKCRHISFVQVKLITSQLEILQEMYSSGISVFFKHLCKIVANNSRGLETLILSINDLSAQHLEIYSNLLLEELPNFLSNNWKQQSKYVNRIFNTGCEISLLECNLSHYIILLLAEMSNTWTNFIMIQITKKLLSIMNPPPPHTANTNTPLHSLISYLFKHGSKTLLKFLSHWQTLLPDNKLLINK